MNSIRPVAAPVKLTGEVAEQLRNAILDGTFKPGEQISQADVARRLEVSRGPVREALRSLIAEGLVVDEPRRGTFVLDPGPNDVREIFDLRVGLEIRAAQLVLAGDPTETVATMYQALEDMARGLKERNPSKMSAADAAFHLALPIGSGNVRLLRLYGQHSAPLRQLLNIENEQVHTRGEKLLNEHREILTLIEAGAMDELIHVLTDHIEITRDRLIAKFSNGR